MRDYKKAVLGMTLALSMVVTGSSLDGITASAAAKSSKKATVKLSSGKLILKDIKTQEKERKEDQVYEMDFIQEISRYCQQKGKDHS